MRSDHFNCLRSNGQEKLESIKQLQAQVADGEGQPSELATAAGSGAWLVMAVAFCFLNMHVDLPCTHVMPIGQRFFAEQFGHHAAGSAATSLAEPMHDL